MKKIVLWAVGVLFFQQVHAGNSVGNGGDFVAIEFVKTARQVVSVLKQKQLSRFLTEAVDQIEMHLNSTHVTSVRVLQLNGKDVDAINYPDENKITVSQVGWYFVKQQEVSARITLVLHEYLGVSRFSDKDYHVSLKLTELVAGQIKLEPTDKDRFIDHLSCLRNAELEIKSAIMMANEFKKPLVPTTFCRDLGVAITCASFTKKSILENPEWFTENQRDVRKMREGLDEFIGMNRYCSSDAIQIDLKKELKFLEEFDLQIKKMFDLIDYLGKIGDDQPGRP